MGRSSHRYSIGPTVVVHRIVYLGKESNKQEEVEVGLEGDIHEVPEIRADPEGSAWAQVARPLLNQISVAEIATAAGTSDRMATHYRQGTGTGSLQLSV